MNLIQHVYRIKLGRAYYEWRCEGAVDAGHQARYHYTKTAAARYTVMSFGSPWWQSRRNHWAHSGNFHTRLQAVQHISWLRRLGIAARLRNNTTNQFERA